MKWIFFLALTAFFRANAFCQSWDSIPGRIDVFGPTVLYADTINNYLYAAGAFNELGGKHIQGIARWNGTQWDSLGTGIDGTVYATGNSYPDNTWAITKYRGKLYVGGVFQTLGNVISPALGTWNGTQWDSLPVQPFKSNYFREVLALQVINNKLYVGGEFDSVDGSTCLGIACWNDTNWSSLNFPHSVYNICAICEYQGSIYAAGHFYVPSDSSGNILRYDGTSWHAVGVGIKGTSAWVNSMVVYDSDLYVAGYFYQTDGNVGNCIQRWDGTAWHDVGGGTRAGQIFKLIVYKGKLYALGSFNIAGGVPATSIAEWDGTQWCSLGSTFNNAIDAACIYKDSLYIGGSFWIINGDSIQAIAEWTGGNYTDSCGVVTTGMPQVKTESAEVKVYPNPASQNITVALNLTQSQKLQFFMYNSTGQLVYYKSAKEKQGLITQKINLSLLPNGLYLIKVNEGGKFYTKKIIKQN